MRSDIGDIDTAHEDYGIREACKSIRQLWMEDSGCGGDLPEYREI
jgi:hypothetical protein